MKRIDDPSPRLDVRDLRVLLGVASAGSTASAAAALHLTQSAVSRALCLAEEKLGARLFERGARGLSPTAAGQKLIAAAGPLLAQWVALEDAVRGREEKTRVRLVCECYTAYRWLPSALMNLRRSLPDLEVTLAIEHSSAPVEALGRGDVDIALLTTGVLPKQGAFTEHSLFSDEIVFVLSVSHPLAKRRELTVADLSSHTLLTSNTPDAEQRWFSRNVFGRRVPKLDLVRFPLTEAIVDAARAGMGIAVMSEWIASAYLEGARDLVVKRFAGKPLRRPWRIASSSASSSVAKRLASTLLSAAPRLYAAS